MKCMCAQTRPRFILSSERVLGGMEFEPMLTPREKSPLPENVPGGGSNPRRCGQRAQTLPTSYSGPHVVLKDRRGGVSAEGTTDVSKGSSEREGLDPAVDNGPVCVYACVYVCVRAHTRVCACYIT